MNLIPEPRSKSQILIGVKLVLLTHRIFSGFRSRCAMPFLCRKFSPDAISLTICAASCSEKHTCCWMRVSSGPPLICAHAKRTKTRTGIISVQFNDNCNWQWPKMFSILCLSFPLSPFQRPSKTPRHPQRTRSAARCRDGRRSGGKSPPHGTLAPSHDPESSR